MDEAGGPGSPSRRSDDAQRTAERVKDHGLALRACRLFVDGGAVSRATCGFQNFPEVDEFALVHDLQDVYWAKQGRASVDLGIGRVAAGRDHVERDPDPAAPGSPKPTRWLGTRWRATCPPTNDEEMRWPSPRS